MQSKILPWPQGVADLLGVAPSTLNPRRAGGDCPRLYTVGPRTLLTTEADVMEWLRSHEVPPGYKARPGTKRCKAKLTQGLTGAPA